MTEETYKEHIHNVGDVVFVYILNKGQHMIIPVQVIERIVKTTLQGDTMSYVVNFDGKTASMSDLKGDIFLTLEAAKKHLTEQFNKTLQVIVDNAVKMQNSWFNS